MNAAAVEGAIGTHGKRIVSALVLAAAALAATWLGGVLFLLLWAAAALAIIWEWTTITGTQPREPAFAVGAAAIGLAVIALWASFTGWASFTLAAVLVLLLGAVVLAAFARPAYWAVVGPVYAGLMLVAVVLLRNDPQLGVLAIVFLLAVVWGTDIAAFYVGRLIGGPKLAQRVSPGKTWSGALGGTVVGVIAGVGVITAGGLVVRPAHGLIALVLAIVAQAGDLFESAVKRRFGAKDSGQLIPGHGGLMDRLDGFIFAVVLAALMGLARGGAAAPAQGLLAW